MWNTKTEKAYVNRTNKEANLGGKDGVFHENFGGEGVGKKTMIDYPWDIGKTSTIFIRGNRQSVSDSTVWCISSGVAPPGQDEVSLATLCRKSPENPLKDKLNVFIEDWLAPSCPETGNPGRPIMEFQVQRAAIFRNWKVFVDGNEVETETPKFIVNKDNGYARGLTDAGMLGNDAFYLSTGGWNTYSTP